tara:strand:+ start:240 stop:716 length:477 start_codon:yes stop_codon:yes gene_type:complete
MKKLIIAFTFTIISTLAFADTGKFNAAGAGSWSVNMMDAGNGNMSITYDGNAGLIDKEPGSIFDKSTMHCIGGLTLVSGKFDDETGMCTFYLIDGEKVFMNYKGKGTGGQGGSGTFVIVGGTGKYEKISGSGFSSRQNLRGKAGMAHSLNQMSGEYTF